jgi:hypothetical protein
MTTETYISFGNSDNMQNGMVRTTIVNSIFAEILLLASGSFENKKAELSKNRLQSNEVSRTRIPACRQAGNLHLLKCKNPQHELRIFCAQNRNPCLPAGREPALFKM